jgi:DNA-directed RNA polymerase subunit RPC12/RpoP
VNETSPPGPQTHECRYCGEKIVAMSVSPGMVWMTLAEEAVCDGNTIGHEPVRVCLTEWCEDYGNTVSDAHGLTCPECGLPGHLRIPPW